MKQVTPKQQSNAKRYFWFVGMLTLLWIVLYINSQPAWTQSLKEKLGFSPVLQASEGSFYNERIDPIFEKYCVACHDANKDKGHLRLDNYRHLTFGGRSDGNLTAYDNNLIIERMMLPADDRLAMPPYGRERHKDSELELIKLWLKKGGSGTMTEADFPEAPAKAKVIKFYDIDWQAIADKRQPMADEVAKLQQLFPYGIHYQARTSHLLTVDLSLIKTPISDQQLAALQKVSGLISVLKLKQTAITDQSLPVLLKMNELIELDITATQVSSAFLSQLLSLPQLQKLFADADLVTPELREKFMQKGVMLIEVERR